MIPQEIHCIPHRDISDKALQKLGQHMQENLVAQFGKKRAALFAYGWPGKCLRFEFSAKA